jgi:hypothetical protein
MSAATLPLGDGTVSPVSGGPSVVVGRTEGVGSLKKAWPTARVRITDAERRAMDSAEESNIEYEPLTVDSGGRPHRAAVEKWVRATVLKVEAQAVTSELTEGDRTWEVSLPRVLFKEPVEYGTPVRIGLKDLNGYRTPVVEVLAATPVYDGELEELRAALLTLRP